MAAMASTCSGLTVAAVVPVKAAVAQRKAAKASVPALGNFAGLKVTKSVSGLAPKKSVEEEFAQVMAGYRSSGSKGGALASECSIAAEIFGVVPIICGLVLTGVALGFVLLRVEAAVEESARD